MTVRPALFLLVLAGWLLMPPAARPNPAQPLTDAELVTRAQGVMAETFGTLSQRLTQALQEGGVRQAVPFCKENVGGLVKPLAEKHGVRIQRVSHKPRNPLNQASPSEVAIIAAMNQALAAGQAPQPRIETIADGSRIVYAPVLIPAVTCLKCHGVPGETMEAADRALILELYPKDQAIGFGLGELRGLWKLTFPPP